MQLKEASAGLKQIIDNLNGGSTAQSAEQISDGLETAKAAAASLTETGAASAGDQVSAAASAVSAAAGTGDALQGDAGTISAGLDSASSAIDILSSIDTSSMDEATAAAVNSAVQSAIGAISGGVATAQGGVASLQAHAGQVSGLSDQAAQVQAAADSVNAPECTDCSCWRGSCSAPGRTQLRLRVVRLLPDNRSAQDTTSALKNSTESCNDQST